MTQYLTAHLIAEALDAGFVVLTVQPAEGVSGDVAFIHKGDGELSATFYGADWLDDIDGIETRTFRLVEVTSC